MTRRGGLEHDTHTIQDPPAHEVHEYAAGAQSRASVRKHKAKNIKPTKNQRKRERKDASPPTFELPLRPLDEKESSQRRRKQGVGDEGKTRGKWEGVKGRSPRDSMSSLRPVVPVLPPSFVNTLRSESGQEKACNCHHARAQWEDFNPVPIRREESKSRRRPRILRKNAKKNADEARRDSPAFRLRHRSLDGKPSERERKAETEAPRGSSPKEKDGSDLCTTLARRKSSNSPVERHSNSSAEGSRRRRHTYPGTRKPTKRRTSVSNGSVACSPTATASVNTSSAGRLRKLLTFLRPSSPHKGWRAAGVAADMSAVLRRVNMWSVGVEGTGMVVCLLGLFAVCGEWQEEEEEDILYWCSPTTGTASLLRRLRTHALLKGGGKTKHDLIFPTCCGHNRFDRAGPGRAKGFRRNALAKLRCKIPPPLTNSPYPLTTVPKGLLVCLYRIWVADSVPAVITNGDGDNHVLSRLFSQSRISLPFFDGGGSGQFGVCIALGVEVDDLWIWPAINNTNIWYVGKLEFLGGENKPRKHVALRVLGPPCKARVVDGRKDPEIAHLLENGHVVLRRFILGAIKYQGGISGLSGLSWTLVLFARLGSPAMLAFG
ncbi:hypothetical protein B0H14DRAFT_3624318 [Mycena olivaceomarginata]|nr:hypothetical protein B0H14DRAFT_3624318 [Mycena olivaceomarginata]